MRATEFIPETFNTVPPYKVRQMGETGVDIESTIGNSVIRFSVYSERFVVPVGNDNGVRVEGYEVSFGRSPVRPAGEPKSSVGQSFHITGSGDQWAVFGFVVAAMKVAINNAEEYAMPAFTFSAFQSEPSRIKLYRRLLKLFPVNFKTFERTSNAPTGDTIYFYAIDSNYLKAEIARRDNISSDEPLKLSGSMHKPSEPQNEI